ncbi:MAG: DinB family protein [Acidimicrobiia bacterium]|nr:DinB family protein [Acidimicrobiia bacterium]NNL27518.1 DinB family protein [Acidimicrobiia bacterium]
MNQPPDPPPPDLKDWTWVLDRTCPECGFEAATVERSRIGELLRENTQAWIRVLGGDEQVLRTRPSADVWSTTEYACHVRDVHRLYSERLELMLAEDNPMFANWDQNEAAVERRYDLADPGQVKGELNTAGLKLADEFDTVAGEQWDRRGRRSDGANFTIETFARYLLHDPVHHLYDVT